jgi:diamine N-acetyltransferase
MAVKSSTGSAVVLTPLTDADLPQLFEWINDRELVELSNAFQPVTEAAHRQWFEKLQRRPDVVIFGIRTPVSDQLIGSCQLHSIQWIHSNAELQIRIGDRSAWGKGYGTEATRRLVHYGFRDLNLHRIYLNVFATNTRALKTYENVGFVAEARHREAAWVGGRHVDLIQMALLRS